MLARAEKSGFSGQLVAYPSSATNTLIHTVSAKDRSEASRSLGGISGDVGLLGTVDQTGQNGQPRF